MALGTIVDLRSRSGGKLSDDFGLFLGFTNVVLRPDDFNDSVRLLQRVAAQTRLHKQLAVPESSMIRLSTGVAVGSMLGSPAVKNFYRKRLPLAGGISNVNMNRTWAREYHPSPLLNYIRVSPTGPMMPVVFTTSTLGDSLHFGLTCRDSVVPPDRAKQLAQKFAESLW